MKDGAIWSHPNKPLEHHLLGTLKIAEEIAFECGVKIDDKQTKALVLHDLAKAHPAFQKKLKYGRGRFGHAEPSSGLVLKLTRDLLYTEAVRRHHSALQSIPSDVWKFWNNWEWNENKKHLFTSLPWWPGADSVAETLEVDIKSWSELLPTEEEWEDLLSEVVDAYGSNQTLALDTDWLRLRMFFSLLVAADRLEAAVGGKMSLKKPAPDHLRFQRHLQELTSGSLAGWRDGVRKEVLEYSRKVLDKPSLYTITLPTGAGKTIIGLQVAIEAAQRFNANRIIYVLPYVSLVEQNAGMASIMFDEVREDHHLAYGKTTDLEDGNDDNEKKFDEFMGFFRYWQEPVIVTTLAKLWEVLYSPRANDAKSFHALCNAIILLDEPQAIPVDCWTGLGHTLEILCRQLNTTFILMTATQPQIFKGQELVPRPISFPSIRHRLHWIGRKMSIEETAGFMVEQGALKHSTLFVLNTRKTALLMWAEMRKHGLEPFFLSRWMTPIDRSRVLQEIKEKEQKKELRCLISTQVIEAGIDLDFELVFRDLGPLDSIIQVAGRCNRHCDIELGKVFIAELGEEGKSFASQVYDSVLLQQTRQILTKAGEFDESSFSGVVANYYTGLQGAINSSDLWENILHGRWGEYVSLFDNYDQGEAMLVIDYDGDIKEIMEQIQNPFAEGQDKMLAIKRRREIFQRLSQQSIPVPIKYLNEWYERCGSMIIDDEEQIFEQINSNMWVVYKKGLETIYRPDLGFVPAQIANLLKEIEYGI